MRTTVALLSVLLAGLLAASAQAQALVPRVNVGQGDLPPLECTRQAVTVNITNQVARVHIDQLFVNHTDQDLEAVYFIPLHESASIHRFSYWVKGEEVVGKVREKDEARQAYETLVANKRDPALLEYAGRNSFRANIFPVSPGEPMRVVVDYTQVCGYDNGTVSFSYPLTAGGKEQVVKQFAVTVNIADQKPIKRVWCPSEKGAYAALKDEHTATVSHEKAKFTPERDFAVNYELTSRDFGVSFLTYRPEGRDGYFMLMVAPQEVTDEKDIVKKDMVFVFDKSGSMQGEKIVQARQALRYCITHLGKTDRFGLVSFNNEVDPYAKGVLLPVSDKHLKGALQYVDGLEAQSGTNIHDALVQAMGMFEPNTNQKTIVFLTDGLPTVGEVDTGAIVRDVADANRRGVRLFTFGVGDDVDDYLLLKLATDNHGAQQNVRTGESIETKVSQFYNKVSNPVLVNLSLDFGAIKTGDVYPDRLPDIFKGSQLIILGRYSTSGAQDITLTGEVNGVPRTFSYPTEFVAQSDENDFIARLWAKARVDWAIDHMRLHGETAELKDEVIALSKEYMFITPYTSFLALPKEEQEALARTSAPAYPVGGDPIIRVQAPTGTLRVTAVFPWGDTMPLKLDTRTGFWHCRFIVPKTASHGEYDIVLIITRGDRSKQRLTVSLNADREAPEGSGLSHATRIPGGWQVRLAVQASDDTSRAQALVPGGRPLEMDFSRDTGRWETTFPLDDSHGESVMVPIILFDRGHNRLTIEVEVELK